MNTTFSYLEMLEPRIAPATLVDASTVNYFDTDGDTVTVKFSKKVLLNDIDFLESVFSFGTGFDSDAAVQLLELNLTDPRFKGVSVSITVAGDPSVDVGAINATGISLGKVVVDGDLGKIVAGSTGTKPGLRELNVGSMGERGVDTQSNGDLQSQITGSVGKVFITGNAQGIHFVVSGGPKAGITSLSIGGSLAGDSTPQSGRFEVQGVIGKIVIGSNLEGSEGDSSGVITSMTRIGSVSIMNSITGGSGDGSGNLYSSGNIGKIFIGNDLEGGDGKGSGRIRAEGSIASLRVEDSIEGGEVDHDTGAVHAGGNIGAIWIGGSLDGNNGPGGASISADGSIRSLTILGSVLGGSGETSGYIQAASIGKTVIFGDVRGGIGDNSGKIISAGKWTSIRIEGELLAGDGNYSGNLQAGGTVNSLYIGEKITGGTSSGSGSIDIHSGGHLRSLWVGAGGITGLGDRTGSIGVAGNLGKATIGGNLEGGALYSGAISVGGRLGSLTLDGSLQGGTDSSGFISAGTIGKIFIAGDIQGGTAANTGQIRSAINIDSLTIGGSIFAGSADRAGSVLADGAIKKMVVKGDIAGFASNPVVISALGTKTNQTLQSILVEGNVSRTIFQGGTSGNSPITENPDASIGKIVVKLNWTASSIVAGVKNSDYPDFGDLNDEMAPDGKPKLLSRIASIVIGGTANGSVLGGDHFGFVSQKIGAIWIGGVKQTLPSAGNFTSLGSHGDFAIHVMPT